MTDKRKAFEEKFAAQLKVWSADDDAWDDVKAGAENIWTEIKSAFQNAASRFK
jgi:hypothetical protein